MRPATRDGEAGLFSRQLKVASRLHLASAFRSPASIFSAAFVLHVTAATWEEIAQG